LVLDSVTGVVSYNLWVTGNNIQTNTYVTNIYPGEDRIEISQAPTAALSAGDTITFIGSNIGVASTSSLVAGARVLGTSIPDNTFINNILGPNNIEISQRPSAPLVDADYLQFYIGQGDYATAIGYDAGIQYQDARAVAVGYSAGTNHQGPNTVAVGYLAGAFSQSANAVAVGHSAGAQTQGINTVAVGYHAGGNVQGARAVAIGEDAGNDNQHASAVAIGAESGRIQQGNAAIAMGWKAGNYYQGLNAIAIGEDAGRDNQGAYSIAIGFYAGFNSQANNTVVLNATGSYLTAQTANTFVVKPIRSATTGNVLYYDQSSGEITFDVGGGSANTGNVTFSDQIVIGTGISNLISGLYLAPSSSSANAVQYLRVRGDVTYEPTHIHFDTGNNQYFNQFIGDDNKYVLLSNTGNIVINTDNYAGNSAQWTFGANGNLTIPGNIVGGGNILIAPDSASASSYLDIYLTGGPDIHIASNDNSIVIGRDTGANIFVGNDGEVSIQASNGTPQVWNFDNTGDLSAPGNISATGNVTGGNLVTAGSAGNITMTGGNITGANVISANIFSATGNIFGNAITLKNTDDFAQIVFSNDGGTTNNGQIKVDGGTNMVVSSNNNFYVKRAGSDRIAVTDTTSDFMATTNVRIQSNKAGSAYTWTFDNTGNVTAPGNVSATGNITAANFFGNGATLSNVATQVTGSWNVPVGNSTQSFTVNSGTYSMWVDCNIPNGILVWNATATVTNTNVPVVGSQYAWVYNGGGTPIDFTSIPNQFTGTSNAIVRSNTAPSATTNRFDFGINNTSGGNVTVRYGWTKIS